KSGKILAKTLCKNSTLISLFISGNQLGSEGVEALVEGFRNNITLNTLNLGNNQIETGRIKALAEILMNNTLTYLNLSYNSLGFKEWEILIEALSKNTTLTSLD